MAVQKRKSSQQKWKSKPAHHQHLSVSGRHRTWSVWFVVKLFKIIVTGYTILTFPIFWLWKISVSPKLSSTRKKSPTTTETTRDRIGRGRFTSAAPESLQNREFLEFEHYIPLDYHPLMKCRTVLEAIYARREIFPIDQKCLAYRSILSEEIQTGSDGQPIRIDGKSLRKYRLTDYRWMTYETFFTEMLSISRGLIAIGLERNDPIAIYSETSLNFLLTGTAAANAGALIVTVFHTLTNEGLVHALNETKAKFMLVSFELIERVAEFVDDCPNLEALIYFEGLLV